MAVASTTERASPLAGLGRALRHRNYRLFFLGQGISLIGTWITQVATSWLVYRLTGSSLMLGVIGFAGQLPSFLLAPFAGVIVDQHDRFRVLLATQSLAMVQSALLALFALTHTITPWHVLALAVFQGLINAFDMPARQAFLVQMVTAREDLPNAIALNSSMFNAARLIGPSVAGVLIAGFGEGVCFAIDAVSYIAVLVALLAMKLAPRPSERHKSHFRSDLREGWHYVRNSPSIRDLLFLLAVTSLTGMPYAVLMPVFASKVLHGGPHTLGMLMAASGVGALCGALWLASRPSVLGLSRVIVRAGMAFGVGLIAFSFSRNVWLSMPILAVMGAGMMVQMASTNTMIQTLSEERMRGRVMSFYAMAFFGMVPFGSLISGWLGSRFGAPFAVRVGGAVTIVALALFSRRLPRLREHMRPIYRRLGILPEVADGLASSSEMPPPPAA